MTDDGDAAREDQPGAVAVSFDALAAFLQARLPATPTDDVPPIWRTSQRPVCRLGLALDPETALRATGLDALFLHRPFRLPADALPSVGILAAHAAFDMALTTGDNPALAAALGVRATQPFGVDGRSVGIVGHLTATCGWPAWLDRVQATFGGYEAQLPHGVDHVERVVLATAMTAPLIQHAAALRVDTYLTGQVRAPGRAPAAALGVGIVAVGHRRAEQWGLHRLAQEFQCAFPALKIVILP